MREKYRKNEEVENGKKYKKVRKQDENERNGGGGSVLLAEKTFAACRMVQFSN
jgi:hypothetical protein